MKYERFERKMMPPEKDMPDLGLSEGEEVLWQGKPKKSAFICNKVLAMMPIALIWAAFDSVFLFVVYGFDTPVVVRVFRASSPRGAGIKTSPMRSPIAASLYAAG